MSASAIVLAGGRSRRFGADKLAVDVAGEPLLHHAVRTTAGVCDEVLVVGAPSGLPVVLPGGLASVPVVVLDVDAYQGPLVALVDAAASASRDRLLVVGGDMPDLVPAVLRRVLDWDEAHEGVCLMHDEWVQPFPMGLDRAAALARGTQLVESEERSLRSLITSLAIERLSEAEWRVLDPAAMTLHDIDRPEDLVPSPSPRTGH